MAKLPALVSAVSVASDRDRSTIEHIARVIREAGLIPTTKRGPGAAEMGAREAANLLLGVAAADVPRAAPETIASLRGMRRLAHGVVANANERSAPRPRVYETIREAGDFGQALEALIEDAGTISAFGRDMIRSTGEPNSVEFLKSEPEIAAIGLIFPLRIYISPSRRAAHIELPFAVCGEVVRERVDFVDRGRASSRLDPLEHVRIQTRLEIGLVPLFMLWAAIKGHAQASGPTGLSL